jgi:rod shape determining protein RodA
MAISRGQKEYDWAFFGLYAVLVIIGIINIHAATVTETNEGVMIISKSVYRQTTWFGVSLVVGFFISLLDVEFIKRNSYIFYGITVLMLIIVLFLPANKGAHSWLGIGSFGIQPSEFAKTATAMTLAQYLTMGNVKLINVETKVISALIVLVPGLLIILQPDPGTFLVFVGFLFVLYREGLSGNWLLYVLTFIILNISVLLLAGDQYFLPYTKIKLDSEYFLMCLILFVTLCIHLVAKRRVKSKRNRRQLLLYLYMGSFVLSGYIFSVNWIYGNVLKDRHRDRISLVLGKVDIDDREVARGIAYNVRNSQSAIGSGGLFGKGYLSSELANEKANLVPEQNTDFIFCTLSEEWGFAGSAIVVLLYCLLLIRIVIIAERQRSNYTRIFAYSVAFILFLHVFINIAMVSGIAPVIGIPLAFMSYGGSSLLAFSVMVFILFKLDSERMNVLS